MTRIAAAVVLTLLAPPASAGDWLLQRPAPKAGHVYPAVYCMNRAERVELGAVACVVPHCCPDHDCISYLARCEMSTNNPNWRKIADGCPESLSRLEAPPSSARPAPG
jgi:hypothetical protein